MATPLTGRSEEDPPKAIIHKTDDTVNAIIINNRRSEEDTIKFINNFINNKADDTMKAINNTVMTKGWCASA
jgi:glycosylphosphatidylinositol transamidase (GPIT) subunit GPI8